MLQVDRLNFDQNRIEYIRWRILKILDAGRPQPVTGALIMTALNDIHLNCSEVELLKEMDYLVQKELVKSEKQSRTPLYSLTAKGIDVVEGNAECPAGIACQE